MNLIDNLRRMITPVSNEDEDYDLEIGRASCRERVCQYV